MFKLFRYLKPYWFQVILLLLSIAIQTWFTLQLPALMADIVNEGVAAGNQDAIWQIGTKMLISAILTALGALSAGYFSSKVGTAFSRDLRKDFYKKVISFSITEIDKYSTASLITRTTNDISQVQETIVMMLSMMLRAPMMSVIAIIQAFNTAPSMTWIIALAIGILITLVVVVLSSVIKKFKLFQKLLDKITLLTRENLTGLRVIRAFNNESYEQKKFNTANTELTNTILFINKIMSLTSPLMNLVFNGICLLCIWVGVSLMTEDISYLGNMMAFMQYAIQVLMSFLVLTIFFLMLPRANVSAARINEVLGETPKIHWKKETIGIPDKPASVEFHHVNFSYGHAEEQALTDISFTAKAGETTAIIGSTGSGKSTLINLIPRFYNTNSGDILVDGINLKDYSEEDLIKKIGFVAQKGILFSGTVKSNIAFGAKNATEQEITEAAKIAQAHDFITKLDDGYSSHIAEGGTNVSGGQKQRLCIARAICKNPEIYIFDDSFSALDMKTDKKLREELKKITKDSVVIIVAQRVSTIKNAEQIIVLEKGKIVSKGTHKELLKNCKVYQEIVKSQLSEKEYLEEQKNVA